MLLFYGQLVFDTHLELSIFAWFVIIADAMVTSPIVTELPQFKTILLPLKMNVLLRSLPENTCFNEKGWIRSYKSAKQLHLSTKIVLGSNADVLMLLIYYFWKSPLPLLIKTLRFPTQFPYRPYQQTTRSALWLNIFADGALTSVHSSINNKSNIG